MTILARLLRSRQSRPWGRLLWSFPLSSVLVSEETNEFPEQQDVKEREVCDLTYVEMNKNR